MGIESGLFVIIPHSGTEIPKELDADNFKKNAIKQIDKEIDIFTDKLYDFKDVFKNKDIIFKYHRGLIDVNQSPSRIDESIPIITFINTPIYIKPPSKEERQQLGEKYFNTFHEITTGMIQKMRPLLILDAHSTHDGDEDEFGDRFDNDISLGNYQETEQDTGGSTRTCSDELIELYAENLQKELPSIKIGINTKYLSRTYGYIEERYTKLAVQNIPLILQETNEKLYTSKNELDELKCRELRRCCALALSKTMRKIDRSN